MAEICTPLDQNRETYPAYREIWACLAAGEAGSDSQAQMAAAFDPNDRNVLLSSILREVTLFLMVMYVLRVNLAGIFCEFH
jgi:hypothetical protein